ncbi:MAG: hypothetical protein GY778_06920 [bacterium]|nr:hypothetical protein [bacterium]
MTEPSRSNRVIESRTLAISLLSLLLAATAADPTWAGEWTIEFEPLLMDAYGHDQHVMTVSDLAIDLAAGSLVDSQVPVSIDTNSGGAYRGKFQYDRGRWGWGVDYLWFNTSQNQVGHTASGNGPFDPVAFEIADRSYVSNGPDEVLFFNVLEDTDLAIWTMDIYAERSLTESPDSGISLLFGLRIGDFDNDYRAVTGVEGLAGTRQDASSNYGAMVGPVVGLNAKARRGKHTFEGYLSQSVLLGEAGLSTRKRDFLGPFNADPVFVIDETFNHIQDVAIPISELRMKWSYQITRRLALGLVANAATWWDIPVPPGVIPGSGPTLHENTIVFFGFGGGLRMTL